MASRSTVNSIKKNIEQNIIEVTNQDGNIIDVIQQTTDVVEIVAKGPQGSKGDKGDKGDTGDIGAFESLLVPENVTVGGNITADGNITAQNFIGTASYSTYAESAEIADTATIAVTAINAETASYIEEAEFAKSIPPKPAGLLGVSEPILYSLITSETQITPNPGEIVLIENFPVSAASTLLISTQSANGINLAPLGFENNNFFFGELGTLFNLKETGSGVFKKGRVNQFSTYNGNTILYVFNNSISLNSGSLSTGDTIELTYDVSAKIGNLYRPNQSIQNTVYPDYNYIEIFQTSSEGINSTLIVDPSTATASVALREDLVLLAALSKSANLTLNEVTASTFVGDLIGTASQSITASYIQGEHVDGTVTSASYSISSSQAISASYIQGENVDGTVASASYAVISGFASVATQASSATLTDRIRISETSFDNTYGLVFVEAEANGSSQVLYGDDQADTPSWNPASNLLVSPNISASSTLYAQTLSLPGILNVSQSIANNVLVGSNTVVISNNTISLKDPTGLSSLSTLASTDKFLIWDDDQNTWRYTQPSSLYPTAGNGISVSGRSVAVSSDFIDTFSEIPSTVLDENFLTVHTDEGARKITPQNLFSQLPLLTTPQNIEFLEVTSSGISSSGDITAQYFRGDLVGTSSLSHTSLFSQTASYIAADNVDQPFTNLSASILSIDGINNVSASIAAAALSGGNFEGGFDVDLEIQNITASQTISASSFVGDLIGTASYATEALSINSSNITQPFSSLEIVGGITQSGGDIILLGLKNQLSASSHVVMYDNITGQLFITTSVSFGGGGTTTTSPGGNPDEIQYNNGGVLAGAKSFFYDPSGDTSVTLNGDLILQGSNVSQSIANLTQATSSYIALSNLDPFITTASSTGNQITFTKGDTSTFNLLIDTGSHYTDEDTTILLNSLQVISGSPSEVRTLLNVEDGASNTPYPAIISSSTNPSLAPNITATQVRTLLNVDPAGTNNSTDVSLTGDYDYITITNQQITRNAIDLEADVTGILPAGQGGTGLDNISGLLNSNVTKTSLGLGNVTNDAQLKLASNLSDVTNVTTARNNLGLGSSNNVTFLTVNANSFTGSLQGTATSATTASYVETAQTASYVNLAQTASYVNLAQTASYVENAQTASYIETAQTASYIEIAQTASYVENAQTASYVENAQTASYLNTTDLSIGGTLVIGGISNVSASIALAAKSGGTFEGGPDSDLEIRHLTASNISASGDLSINGIPNVSASIASLIQEADNLGNHTASLDLYMGGNDVVEIGSLTSTAYDYDKRILLGGDDNSIDVLLDSSTKYRFFTTAFRPSVANVDLGTISFPWRTLYNTNINASGYVSASSFIGDGSQLTGIGSNPFPYIGNAQITGSLSIDGGIGKVGNIIHTGSKGIYFDTFETAIEINPNISVTNPKLQIYSSVLTPSQNNVMNLGASTKYWKTLYTTYISSSAIRVEGGIVNEGNTINNGYVVTEGNSFVGGDLQVEGNTDLLHLTASNIIATQNLSINGISNVSASIAAAALSGGAFEGGPDSDLEVRYLTASIVSASTLIGNFGGTIETASYIEPLNIGELFSQSIATQFSSSNVRIDNNEDDINSLQSNYANIYSIVNSKLNSTQTGSGFNTLKVLGDITLSGLVDNIDNNASHIILFNNTTGLLSITGSSAFGGLTGGTTPNGSFNTIQFNSSGEFGGNDNFTFSSTTNTVSLTGSLLVNGIDISQSLSTIASFPYVGDAEITGALDITGDLSINGIPNVSASIAEIVEAGGGFSPSLTKDLLAQNITASQNISSSGYISASFFVGDGSQLTGTSGNPFPYDGNAEITGSLNVTGDVTASALSVLGVGIPTIESPTNIILSASNAVVVQGIFQLPGITDVSASIALIEQNYVTGGSETDLEFRSLTASIVSASSFTGSLQGTAATASYILGSNVSGKVLQANIADEASVANSIDGYKVDGPVTSSLTASYIDPTNSQLISLNSSIQTNVDNIEALEGNFNTLNNKSLVSESSQIILEDATIQSIPNFKTKIGLGTGNSVEFNNILAPTAVILSITGSLQGTATTASYVETAQTASYVTLAQTASYATLAQTASYVETAQTASYVTLAQTASYVTLAQTASYVETAQTASYLDIIDLSIGGTLAIGGIPNVSASIAAAAESGGTGGGFTPSLTTDLVARNITASGFITSSDLETGDITTKGTVQLKNISDTTPQNHILTYNTSTGQVYITSSTSFGFGTGGGNPGGNATSIQYNDAGAFGGSDNFTITDESTRVDITVTGSIIASEKVYADDFVLTGLGMPTITSNTNLILSASNAVEIRSPFLRFKPTTTGSAEAQGASPGDVIYDSEQDKFFGKTSAGWIAFH